MSDCLFHKVTEMLCHSQPNSDVGNSKHLCFNSAKFDLGKNWCNWHWPMHVSTPRLSAMLPIVSQLLGAEECVLYVVFLLPWREVF